MKRKQAARLFSTQKQGGFLLPQLAVFVLILSVVMGWVGQRYWQDTVRQSGDDRARLVGTMLSTVNDATKTYATTFFTQIQQAQSITRNGYTVPPARVLAPTLADLNALGFLASRAVNPIIYNGQSIGFKVQLTVDTSSGCTVPTCNLTFQATTTTPLLNPRSNTVDVRRATMAATTASPGNAGVSMPVSFGGNPNVFVTSNGTQTGTNPGGVAGLISVSNGYDSSGFFMFDRRDGSLPRTGDINMQDTSGARHNINNAGTVNSEASVTGTLQVTGLAVEGQACTQIGLIASSAGGKLLGCNGVMWGKATDMPNAHRYLFTTSTSWTVPSGVKSALVTMAGGGASGYGWRFSNHFSTGSSGGFVFSAPVNLVEGETITVTVGKGGVGFSPYNTGVPVTGMPGLYVWGAPPGDDGLGGYPGGASMLVSPSAGILLECDGGSGASTGTIGIDSFSGSPVAGNVPGAVTGSGVPSYAAPNRPAAGPYASPSDGPGACGFSAYGIGNPGTKTYATGALLPSGSYAGGMSPFGYGTGGMVGTSGCYVSQTQLGTCVSALKGRDGVVMIDVLY